MSDREKLCDRFGRLIRRERAWLGLTQHQVADAASLSQAELSNVENGKVCPGLDTVVNLLAALGMDPREALEALD